MSKTVLGVFDSRDKAEQACKEIRDKGFNDTEINLVAKEDKGGSHGATMSTGEWRDGANTGAWVGGAAGLLASAGALAIPGIGPVLAAGPIAATLGGALTGGIAGGLIDWGIPEDRGKYFEGKVKEGNVLAVIKTSDDKIPQAEGVLKKHGASDVEVHQTK